MVTYGYRSNVKNFSPPSEHRTWWNDLRLLVYHSQHKTTPTGSLQQCVHGHTHHNAFLNYKSTSWFRYSTVGAKCPLILWASCSVVTLLNVSNKNAIGFLSISMRWRAISVYTAQVAMPLSNLHPMQACKSRLTKKNAWREILVCKLQNQFFSYQYGLKAMGLFHSNSLTGWWPFTKRSNVLLSVLKVRSLLTTVVHFQYHCLLLAIQWDYKRCQFWHSTYWNYKWLCQSECLYND